LQEMGLIVGIGASAGGLGAFSELLKHLPQSTGMAFVLVQHLDPHHESILADLLKNWTQMPVVQAQSGAPVEADHVYVIPPNATLLLVDRTLQVVQPKEQYSYQRRPIDAFFTSLADTMHSRAIGVVLSGAASDGTLGLKAIKAEGGITFAQDASAEFDGMPRSAIAAGYADFVLSPKRIAQELAAIASHPLAKRPPEEFIEDFSVTREILALLQKRTGVDFCHYKMPTIQRRMARRMVVAKAETPGSYLALLQRDPREANALFEDLLIKVTEFFRDPAVFEALKRTVFPAITKNRAKGEALRVWVPGCSTGEEVYSIAIVLLEYLEAEEMSIPVQVFGTDVSEMVIEKARSGVYDDSGVSSLAPERLRRFFVRTESGFQISRRAREMCVFSRHNLGTDPPLSRMDLISCRNLLIYFRPTLQRKVIDILAYALRPNGCLLVGPSENTGRLSELFDPMDQEHRIYVKKSGLIGAGLEFLSGAMRQPEGEGAPSEHAPAALEEGRATVHTAGQFLLSRDGPSGLVVDKDFRIVDIRGDVSPYLQVPAKADARENADLLDALPEPLVAALRAAIPEAHERNTTVRLDQIQMRGDKAFNFLRLTVIPLSIPPGEPHSVVLFEREQHALKDVVEPSPPARVEPRFETAVEHVKYLEQELASSREYLQLIIEELRSTIEEVQSANEELQSSNEELQTTKEELQSSNEELTTINAEMQNRNAQLAQANDDLMNLLSSISVPIVMVGNDLRIRRFTPAAQKVLRLIPGDVGRPISDINPRINVPDLDKTLGEVLESLRTHEREVEDLEGRSYLLRVRPYRTEDNRIDGAVLLLTDVTDMKQRMEEVKRAREHATAIVETIREPLLVLEDGLAVRSANRSFYEFFHCGAEEIEGHGLYSILGGKLDLPQVRQLLTRLSAGDTMLRDVEIEHDFVPIGQRTLLLNARRIAGGPTNLILLAFEDTTEKKRAAEARYRRLFDSARDGVVIVDAMTSEVLDANPYMRHLFGYSREELVGKKLTETAFAAENPLLPAALDQIRDRSAGQFTEMDFRSRDGRTVQTELIGNVYDEGSRRAIQLNLRDFTERRKFERELQHTQKLESLGLLAGGIAHDFNNLLTGVLGNASLAYSELRSGSPLRQRLRSIITAAERASDLTRQLLAYAGKGRFILEQIDLSSLVREILALLQSSIPKSVDLGFYLGEDLPPVETDASQMQQLVMNLVINGAEAIGEGNSGTVWISTSVLELGEADVRDRFASEGLNPGTYVALEVKDTGAGMDEATKAKIFDPFFTTKFTGRGLGLAAVSGIVRAHRGAIRVYSTPGRGTSFLVLLPAVEPVERVPRPKRPRRRVQRSGTVLVIDDESVARDTARTMLENAGFNVLLAENGGEGVEIFREHGKMISLVILDLTMPGANSEQVFDLLRSIRADVPVVLASGYDQREMAERGAGKDFAGFLHKPFDVDTLLEVVDTALGRSHS
jgi:two-component system CheB/CheR fusion protein